MLTGKKRNANICTEDSPGSSTVDSGEGVGNGGPGPATAVWASGVSAAYNGEPPVLSDINLALPSGKLIALIGPNGAGKSTFFNLLTGIKRHLSGELLIFGTPVEIQRRDNQIAYVPQQEDIDWDYPIRVWDVVLGGRYGHIQSAPGLHRFLPPAMAGREHAQAVEEALRAVDMLSCSRRPIGALSGGQKKRVFLARALAQRARLQLLDEPLVGVDRESAMLILEVLKELRSRGRTIIMVTHDLDSACDYADQMVLLNRTVLASGKPERVVRAINNNGQHLQSLSSPLRTQEKGA